MIIVIFLMTLAVEGCIRSTIDYSTFLGNCTKERPIFGSPVTGKDIGCHSSKNLVKTVELYERIKFMDINEMKYLKVVSITEIKIWEQYKWIPVPNDRFRVHRAHLIFVPPPYGQLIYICDNEYVHLFIRTFGPELQPTLVPTTRKEITTSIATTLAKTTSIVTTQITTPSIVNFTTILTSNKPTTGYSLTTPSTVSPVSQPWWVIAVVIGLLLAATTVLVGLYYRKQEKRKKNKRHETRALIFYNNAYDGI